MTDRRELRIQIPIVLVCRIAKILVNREVGRI
jgi:hypothetical protein